MKHLYVVSRPTEDSVLRVRVEGLMDAHRLATKLGGWVEVDGGGILEDPRAISERSRGLTASSGRVSQSEGSEADNVGARK